MRSAEPPSNSGMAGPSASRTFCEALRVARLSASALHRGEQVLEDRRVVRCRAGRWCGVAARGRARDGRGDSLRSARSTSPACRDRGALASHESRTSSGTSNGGCVPAQRLARRRRSPSAPSGSPCALAVPAVFGAPLPIAVLQQISVGRRACDFAATMARSHAHPDRGRRRARSRSSRTPRSASACRR